MEQKSNSPKSFDPFAGLPDYSPSAASRSWFWATALQSVVTMGLLVLAYRARGKAWEKHADAIVILGIVGTWSLALRTIRERLVELMRCWRLYSMGLIRKASESGRHMIVVPLSKAQEAYIKNSIWRLRIIAAGLTIPFFVMPLMWSVIAVVFSMKLGPYARDYWTAAAVFTMLSALIVAGYFHWAILPLPTAVRVSGSQRRFFASRKRSRWGKGL
jgi:hypothetical protein